MNIAFCIGNGPSIKKIQFSELKEVGPTYGCNQLIEKVDLDNTIIVDRNLLIDLISRGFNKKSNIYTRKRWQSLIEADNVYFLSEPIKNPSEKFDKEIHWGSGTHALNLAASKNPDIILMLGYDLYNSKLDPACWIYQINKCFEKYPEVQFVQIQDKKWKSPKLWTAENYQQDDFKGLVQLIKDIS